MLNSSARLDGQIDGEMSRERDSHSLGVEIAENGDDNAEDRHGGDLVTRANQRSEENRVSRRAKHIAVDLFPAVLIAQVPFLEHDSRSMTEKSTAADQIVEIVVFAVASVVFSQGPEENHADQSDEEQNHHERIEDGKPMDLERRSSGGRTSADLTLCWKKPGSRYFSNRLTNGVSDAFQETS